MNRRIAIALLAIAGILFGYRVVSDLNARGNDETQIRVALNESIKASKDGKAGGVLDLFSQNLTLNRQEMPVDRRQIAQFIKDYKPDVEIPNQEVQVIGEEARIISPMELSIGPFGTRTVSEATFVFKRESDRLYGIIPSSKWRLTDVTVDETAIQDLVTGG